MLHRRTVIFGILLLAVSAAGPALAGPYYVTDLGILASGTGYDSYAMGVNDYGVVVGGSTTSKASSAKVVATIYTPGPGAAWQNIGSGFASGAGGTFATGISDAGLVSGWLRINTAGNGGPNNNQSDSFIYNTSTKTFTDIAAQPGVCYGVANQCGQDTFQTASYTYGAPINSSGQIVGEYNTTVGSETQNLFVYGGGSTSVVTTVATNSNAESYTGASGINNSGVIVGNYSIGMNPTPTGFYYANGAEHDISNMSSPEAIVGNEVVGTNYDDSTGTVTQDAMIYTLGDASATNIGTLGYADQTIPYGVSSSGTVVGTGTTSPTASAMDAFVYSNGTMTDLNAQIIGPNPFLDLNVATAISANGVYVVGDGTVTNAADIANGGVSTSGFLLTPAIPGDANGDGRVDINDLTIVLAHYGQTGQTWADGEFTGDGTVDINDLTIVLANYNQSIASAAGNLSAVPEPGTLLLLAAGLGGLLAAGWKRVGPARRAAA